MGSTGLATAPGIGRPATAGYVCERVMSRTGFTSEGEGRESALPLICNYHNPSRRACRNDQAPTRKLAAPSWGDGLPGGPRRHGALVPRRRPQMRLPQDRGSVEAAGGASKAAVGSVTNVAPLAGVAGVRTSSGFPFGMGATSFLGASLTPGVAGT